MKYLILLICLSPLASFSQTLNQKIHYQYFRQKPNFDQKIIAEKKIASITKREIYLIGDSVVDNVILSRTTFRPDGKPLKNRTIKSPYERDSSYIQCTYDSIGNLTESSYWTSDRGEYGRNIYEYSSDTLKRVFNYSSIYGGNNSNELKLRSADSLVYSATGDEVTIFHANLENRDVSIEATRVASPFVEYKNTISKGINMPTPPKYADLTKTEQMISKEASAVYLLDEMTTKRNKSKVKKDVWELVSIPHKAQGPFDAIVAPYVQTTGAYFKVNSSDSLDMRGIQRVNFKNKTIEFQEANITDPPTNERSTSYHRTVYHYDFSMRLLWKEEYYADLANGYPDGLGKEIKTLRTVYEYDQDGLLKQELMIFLRPEYTSNKKGMHMEKTLYEITYFE